MARKSYLCFLTLDIVALPFLILLIATETVSAQVEVVWQRQLGGMDDEYTGRALKLANGNILVAGWQAPVGSFSDDLICILNQEGDSLTSYLYGGTMSVSLLDAVLLEDGRVLCAGTTYVEETEETDFHILRTLAGGEPIIATEVDYPGPDELASAYRRGNGNIILVGTTSGGQMGQDILVACVNDQAETVWTTHACNSGLSVERAESVTELTNGVIVVAGSTTPFEFPLDEDFFIVGLSAEGDSLWSRQFGTDNQERIVDTDRIGGDVLVAIASIEDASANLDMAVMSFDTLGSILWETVIGDTWSNEEAADLIIMDGAIFVLGTRTAATGMISPILAALNMSGDTLWTHVFEFTQNLAASSISVAENGQLLMAGVVEGTQPPFTMDMFITLLDIGSSVGQVPQHQSGSITVAVYPNPVTEQVHMRLNGVLSGYCEVSIYNILGQMVTHSPLQLIENPSTDLTIPLPNTAPGMYFVRVNSPLQTSMVVPIMKLE
jgi:hypothetical protein